MRADYGSFDPFTCGKVRTNRSRLRSFVSRCESLQCKQQKGLIRTFYIYFILLHLTVISSSRLSLWEHVVVLKRTESLWFLLKTFTRMIQCWSGQWKSSSPCWWSLSSIPTFLQLQAVAAFWVALSQVPWQPPSICTSLRSSIPG